MSSSPSRTAYPPRITPSRQQSRTPLLDPLAIPSAGSYSPNNDAEPTTRSPLLEGRRGSDGSSGSISPIEGNSSIAGSDSANGMTPLDVTLEEIGMGKYQLSLLVLCGLGWAADNMWLQCVAVILPRVQESFHVGAWGWGSYSDAKGRVPAFNLTLLLTAVFGLASAFAPSFGWLCFALFLLGTGVGGSMPTDGTLFIENLPKTSHYLLTALSVFFSLGAIFTSVLGLAILPRYSCSPAAETTGTCTVETDNIGWRYMLGALGTVSIVMFFCRVLFIRLQESPKFLVASNRPTAAVIALRRISKINGREVQWGLSDVVDGSHAQPLRRVEEDGEEAKEDEGGRRASGSSSIGSGGYDATGETNSPSRGGGGSGASSPPSSSGSIDLDLEASLAADSLLSDAPTSLRRCKGSRPSVIDYLPPSWRAGAEDYAARVAELFEGEGRRTTGLVFVVWTLASAGYTIFNVFLPKFLETKLSSAPSSPSSQEETLRDYVLYTLSGLPGSLIGAYLVETSWGRAKTLALSTLATSGATFVFVFVEGKGGVVMSSMAVSLASTLMYAVIYGWSPELFPTSTRGTATGLASALSRLAGILAPLLTGLLLSISTSLPLFVSGACFAATAAAAWGLRGAEAREGGGRKGGRTFVH
ncbi:hypothetical protein JCM8097_001915 [Rhodosporidiobolus ruineniae]